MTNDKQCEHKFVLLGTVKYADNSGYNTHFVRVDTFFCERCLAERELRKDSYDRDTPEWYR